MSFGIKNWNIQTQTDNDTKYTGWVGNGTKVASIMIDIDIVVAKWYWHKREQYNNQTNDHSNHKNRNNNYRTTRKKNMRMNCYGIELVREILMTRIQENDVC